MKHAGLVGIMMLVGCGDAGPAEVEYTAPGAIFLAVRADYGPWQRIDGDTARFAVEQLYEVVVVCRGDLGDGWSVLATPGEEPYTRRCRPAEGVRVDLEVTGSGRGTVFLGEAYDYDVQPLSVLEVVPGTHDAVILRDTEVSGGQYLLDGIQVVRDVVVDGPRGFAVDLDAGVAPAVATIEVDGVALPGAQVSGSVKGRTASGTWFRIFGTGFTAALPILPDALRVPGDEQLVRLEGTGRGWVEVEVSEAPLVVTTPQDVIDPTFTWDPVPSLTVALDASWTSARIGLDGPLESLASWALHVTPGALALRTANGQTALAVNPPQVEGWNPAWYPDPAQLRIWRLTLSRARAGGGTEGTFATGSTEPQASAREPISASAPFFHSPAGAQSVFRYSISA